MLELANTISRGTQTLEVLANAGASIPLYGIQVSSMRINASSIQMVTGLTFAAFGVLALAYANSADDEKLANTSAKVLDFGVNYAAHGVLNFYRGMAEITAQLLTFGLGPLIFNIWTERPSQCFQPIVKYRIYHLDGYTCPCESRPTRTFNNFFSVGEALRA